MLTGHAAAAQRLLLLCSGLRCVLASVKPVLPACSRLFCVPLNGPLRAEGATLRAEGALPAATDLMLLPVSSVWCVCSGRVAVAGGGVVVGVGG